MSYRLGAGLLLVLVVATATTARATAFVPMPSLAAAATAAARAHALHAACVAGTVQTATQQATVLAARTARLARLAGGQADRTTALAQIEAATRQAELADWRSLREARDELERVLRLAITVRLQGGGRAEQSARLRALLASARTVFASRLAQLEDRREQLRQIRRAQLWEAEAAGERQAMLATLRADERRMRTAIADLVWARTEALRRARSAAHLADRLTSLALAARRWSALAWNSSPRLVEPPAVRHPGAAILDRSQQTGGWRLAAAPAASGRSALAKPALIAGAGQIATAPTSFFDLPVEGVLAHAYGDQRAGLFARGVTLLVGNPRTVRAPRGGRVVFSSPFRDYGPVLILDHGDGYHTLIAGMDRIDVAVHEQVQAGQVVGRLVASPFDPRRVYVELRLRGEPVDPLPWLASRHSGEAGSG